MTTHRGQRGPDPRLYSQPAWTYPQPQPTYVISEEYDSPLDPKLNDLAFALLGFDFKLVKKVCRSVERNLSQISPLKATATQNEIREFKNIQKQENAIRKDKHTFARRYLTDRAFTQIWDRAFKLNAKTLSSRRANAEGDNIETQFQECLDHYVQLAATLMEAIYATAGDGLLSEDIEEAIAARWRRLDSFMDRHCRYKGSICEDNSSSTRIIPRWRDISICIRKKQTPNVLNQDGHVSFRTSHSSGDIVSPVYLSYLLLCVGAVLSSVIFAFGYSRSPHTKGSIHDADFFFFIQASIAQTTCLISSTLLTWKGNRALSWHWFLPTGLASFCALSTAPLYIFTPTEWASFSALIATLLQSVLILHPFFVTCSDVRQERERKLN